MQKYLIHQQLFLENEIKKESEAKQSSIFTIGGSDRGWNCSPPDRKVSNNEGRKLGMEGPPVKHLRGEEGASNASCTRAQTNQTNQERNKSGSAVTTRMLYHSATFSPSLGKQTQQS